ncbi:BPTI/Kunitz domain-containing protein-like [Hypanus sabinus]|uniref:BPTI/Kunitz domain-containing protein-like n=1 Tax=Hypanus sabinus TaxID=79690 RepID=UPI0028C420A1|nr:BPTI/Kunitz domain-containing protein-like [Hypanus sabinus]
MKWGIVVLVSCILLLSLPCYAEEKVNCSDPKKIGSCKNYFPYYYYNTKTQKCEKFMYSGCGGNGNRFMQKNDCIIRCERSSSKFLKHYFYKCSDPKKSGPCKAAFPRYYYNAKTRKCEKFKFGGCGATGNNFLKQSDCIALCERSSINCSDPKKIGSCKNYFPYYYYNTKTQKCEKFMYSGCGGNGNRFMQKNDCIIRCERSSKAK